MAKLNKTPLALYVIKALIVFSCIIAVYMFVAACCAGDHFLWEVFGYGIGVLILSGLISGFYYIVKAACLIIQKEESEEKG